MIDRLERFPCFGGVVTIRAAGPASAIAAARRTAEHVHVTLTRFDAASELSRLNADPREAVPASEVLCPLAAAVAWAGERSGGLVDATCLDAVEAAGYREHFDDERRRGWRAAAAPVLGARAWADVRVAGGVIHRPPGVRLDSGGLGKGLAADLMAEELADCEAWAVDCGGDLRIGGTAGIVRAVDVRDPRDERGVVARLRLAEGAVATSGTTRRSWTGGHHLIDPRTGLPARTGVVQATAVAPTGLEAEVRAKTALLAGRGGGAARLPDGGAIVTAAGRTVVVQAAAASSSSRSSGASMAGASSLP